MTMTGHVDVLDADDRLLVRSPVTFTRYGSLITANHFPEVPILQTGTAHHALVSIPSFRENPYRMRVSPWTGTNTIRVASTLFLAHGLFQLEKFQMAGVADDDFHEEPNPINNC